MRQAIYFLFVSVTCFRSQAQERLFFFGTTKNYISADSTNFALNVDLNRVPGATEKVGGTFFVNTPIGTTPIGFYWKPSVDINLGTGTTSAPNNVNAGLPFGFVYDGVPLSELFIEMSPEFVADRDFKNYLRYFSIGPYAKFEYLRPHFLFNFLTGVNFSFGSRDYSAKDQETTAYQRITIPIYTKFELWQDSSGKGPARKAFRRIHITNSMKINSICKDNPLVTPDKSLFYNNSKLDIYIIPRIGISLNYIYGFEEPIFKKAHSLTFGIVFARF